MNPWMRDKMGTWGLELSVAWRFVAKAQAGVAYALVTVCFGAGCMVVETEEDSRVLCVGNEWEDQELALEEGAPLEAAFTSSSCGTVTEAWCELTLEAGVLTARTYHQTEHPWHSDYCLAIDKNLDVRCLSEPLVPGQYTLRYGGLERDLEVPSTIAPFCLDPR